VRVFASPDAASFKPDRVDNLLASLADRQDPATANEAEECAAISGGAIEPARRLACAPIAIGSRIDAALCLVNKPVDFISGDVKLIAALADVVAGFLERERSYERELAQIRFQRELEIAADIQSRLMPREVPSVPGVQLAALWRPSREVGGDFYNVQVLPGNRLALALGDITGKGVPAALFMATAHGLLRSGFATTRSPAEAVRQLNAGLAADLVSADRLLTLFAAIFDPATGELRAFNCGHSPILICQGGVVKLWEADGPPIGLLPDLLSIERKRFLKSGDVLVALSDGFSEARDALGRRLGIEPLMDVVWRAAAGEASTIAAALQEQVDVFEQGRPRNDDQTLIVLKVE
ncbi:MAG TPA: PP2C family protein-serine/threonine phosphatase, partial [Anaerolineae bacterium]